MKQIPTADIVMPELKQRYPEGDSFAIYTHMWMRLIGSAVEDAVENFLSRYSVSSGRFLMMMLLEFSEVGLKPSELASQLGVTQATVTGLIDGLEQSGYAKRREHPQDGRACVVALTDKGKSFMSEARPEFNRWVTKMYSVLNDGEKDQLIGIFQKFFSGLNMARVSE